MDSSLQIKTKLSWLKPGRVELACVVGNAAIAIGMENYIALVDLKTAAECYYLANSSKTGRGVSCLAGHKYFAIYAFAERCINPRILLISYPSNTALFILDGDLTAYSYTALAFTESEYLVALTGMPDYSLEVYAWRNREMLCKKASQIFSEQQTIICSHSSTQAVCQYAARKCDFKLWEITGNIRLCRLIERTITMPFAKCDLPMSIAFLIDGNLAVINRAGKFCIVSSTTGHIIYSTSIAATAPSDHCIPSIMYCKGGILICLSSHSLIEFYKRQKGSWNQLWTTKPPEGYAQLLQYSVTEGLLGITECGSVMRTSVDNDIKNVEFSIVKQLDPGYTNITPLPSISSYFVVFKMASNTMVSLNFSDGSVASVKAIDKLRCSSGSSMYPCIVAGTDDGLLILTKFDNTGESQVTSKLFLSKSAICHVTFGQDGISILSLDSTGCIAILTMLPNFQLSLIHLMITECSWQNPILFHWDIETVIVELQAQGQQDGVSVGSDKLLCAAKLLQQEETIWKVLQLSTVYSSIAAANKNDTVGIFGVKLLSNEIDLLNITRCTNGFEIVKCKTISVDHSLRYMDVFTRKQYLFAWSFDGRIVVYEMGTMVPIANVECTSSYTLGFKEVALDTNEEHLIVVTHSGQLIVQKVLINVQFRRRTTILAQPCYEIVEHSSDVENEQQSSQFFESKSLIEIESQKKSLAQGEVFEPMVTQIFEEFNRIQSKLQLLLDANEKAPPEECFPVQAFNLNHEATMYLTSKANIEKEQVREKLQHFMKCQEEINATIIRNCWEDMELKPFKIRPIFTKSFVENYATLPKELDNAYLEKVNVYRETELMASHDALLPWKPTPTYQLESILNRDPDYGNVIDTLSRAMIKRNFSLSGTTTHLFVDTYELRYEQLETVTFSQLYFETFCGKMEIEKLRHYFNEKFEKHKELKSIEMELVLKRNERIRYVAKEMALMSKLMHGTLTTLQCIQDPVYEPDECPEKIVHTEDYEVTTARYTSPSVENLMYQERLEREERQRLLLADDFKDRALIVMMDGVLEHRWEDEIKKSVPLPQCLEIGKDPINYSESDIREVNEYETQSKALHQERLRYLKMLQEERQILHECLSDQIKKFNTATAHLLLQKIEVESAIRQEEMRVLRVSLYNHTRLMYDRNADGLRSEVHHWAQQIDDLTEVMNELQEKLLDHKNTYEVVRGKDRLLDKQFKINFSDTAQSALVDQAYKIFKRRPKVQLRSIVTVSVFQDMAKRVVAKKTMSQSDLLLPKESIDYLSASDNLDQSSNCPAGMDNSMWQTLCKMRRFKMESEFKLKINEILLSDAEAAIGSFQREITAKRNLLSTSEQCLETLKNEKFEHGTNRMVQIIMKRGLIEVELSGKTSDFQKSVLIHRTDVEDINAIIRRAGSKKINSMVNAALFRRKIISQEWEHKTLKLRIRDLQDQLKTVEKCKITKEVQSWLKRKGMQRPEDFSQAALEKEINNTIFNEEKLLKELIGSLDEIEKRIYAKHKENKMLDQQTRSLNIDVTEQHLQRDTELEQTEQKAVQDRMSAIVERARLVRLVQAQHTQILELGTMLELQRLKTYPTLTASTSIMEHNAHHLLGNKQ